MAIGDQGIGRRQNSGRANLGQIVQGGLRALRAPHRKTDRASAKDSYLAGNARFPRLGGQHELWEDIKFDLKHFNHIERLAMLGESKWEKGMAAFCKPFTTAKIRYFDSKDAAAAREWIAGN